MDHVVATDPVSVLEKNKDVWGAAYAERAKDLGPVLERIRGGAATVRADLARSHGARCVWTEDLLDRLAGAQVLEVGGGSGETACLMLALGAERVVTTEITEEAGAMMRALGDEMGFGNRLEVHVGDFFTMPLGPPHSFDVVMAKEVLHHITPVDEDRFVARTASMLAPGGVARFKDPAVNSRLLDRLRWAVPMPGRPSNVFQRAKFAEWKSHDEHPDRDNSTAHVTELLLRHFQRVEPTVTGTLGRFHRVVDSERWHDTALATLNRLDRRVPLVVQMKLGDNHGFSAYEPRRITLPAASGAGVSGEAASPAS